MRILDAESMKQIDRSAIEEFGIPSLVLMENAAIGLVDAIGENFPDASSACVFCGPGNNGGDGLALARHLSIRGFHLEIFLLTAGRSLSPDAQAQLNICQNQGLMIRELSPDDDVQNAVETARTLDLVVDGLFGIGLSRPLDGQFAEIVNALNSLARPTIAIDLPSGLSGAEASISGPHIQAELTVTFGAPKIAHVFSPAAEVVGRVVVADLGIPTELLARAGGRLHLLVGAELANQLAPRAVASHKGDYGHTLLIAGSTGKAGAAILAARSAVRSGAGLVTAAVPIGIVQTVDGGSIESMTSPLSSSDQGGLDPAAVEQVLELAAGKDSVAIGPGLGLNDSTVAVVRSLVATLETPLVIDADGLNALVGHLSIIRDRTGETVLTPHPGELARLLSTTSEVIQADRLKFVRQASESSGAVVVLKGHRTLIANPIGEVFVNPTGNPGMASGGMGDVLTGMIAALVAQGLSSFEAAKLGVYLHGLAGDLIELGDLNIGLTAVDLIEKIPQAFEQLGR